MRVSPVDGLGAARSAAGAASASAGAQENRSDPAVDFKNAVKKAIGQVNDLQSQADRLAVGLASGDVEDVHEAMVAMQKAKLALDFTIQVRNKVVEAYQEIMRMQV